MNIPTGRTRATVLKGATPTPFKLATTPSSSCSSSGRPTCLALVGTITPASLPDPHMRRRSSATMRESVERYEKAFGTIPDDKGSEEVEDNAPRR